MFTRQLYDPNAYQHYLSEWVAPGKYMLMPESTHRGTDTCFQEIPDIQGQTRQYKISDVNRPDMVNIESDLRNLIRINSKDPKKKYPFIAPGYSDPIIPTCTGAKNDFDIIYHKLEGSQWNRGKSIHIPRFESLCLYPQQGNRIRSNNVQGLATRLYNRDTDVQIYPDLSPKPWPFSTINIRAAKKLKPPFYTGHS